MPSRPAFTAKFVLLIIAIIAIVSAPFVIWGDSFVMPLLQSYVDRTSLLILIAIILLAADSVAPVPATLVIMYLAAKGGTLAGIVGGTVGMAAGVLTAAWFGRTAVGRLAPKFFPEAELARMRAGLAQPCPDACVLAQRAGARRNLGDSRGRDGHPDRTDLLGDVGAEFRDLRDLLRRCRRLVHHGLSRIPAHACIVARTLALVSK
jgi:hypothetical protein